MDMQSRTDRAFDALRQAPPEIPLEKIEQFVIAGAAAGTFSAAGVSKFAFKFHLNTIIAMTSAATATIAGLFFLLPSATPETAEAKTSLPAHRAELVSEKQAAIPAALAVDSPAVQPQARTVTTTSTVITPSGDTTSRTTTTTVTSGSGVSVSVTSNGNGVTTIVNTGGSENENYTYAYSSGNENDSDGTSGAFEPATWTSDWQQPLESSGTGAATEAISGSKGCHSSDTLKQVIERALLEDGLITSTKRYTFEFRGNTMRVNGKTQPQEIWERYRNLIEENSSLHVNRRFEYQIAVSGNSTTININND